MSYAIPSFRPAGFAEDISDKNCNSLIPEDMLPPSDSDSDNEHLGEQVINTNRPTVAYDDESSDENEDLEEDGWNDSEAALKQLS